MLTSMSEPFNGINPNGVVILDNCTIHHVAPVTQLINSVEPWYIIYLRILPTTIPLNGVFQKLILIRGRKYSGTRH
jgi:hypothetical protein